MPSPLTLYSHRFGPNPWKTVVVMLELGIPNETIYLELGNGKNGVQSPEFLLKNPAGRVPLIRDPNTGVLLAESNAITQYLTEHYDPERTLTFDTEPEKHLINQWLMFQGASQGPIYAQTLQAARKGNSVAVEHLQGIVKRTLGTLNDALQDKKYLVGNKCTISDLSFLNWDLLLDRVLAGDPEAASAEQREALFAHWASWHNRILQRPSVQTAIEMQRAAIAAGEA